MACIARIIAAVSIPAGRGGQGMALTAYIFPVFSRTYNMRSRYFADRLRIFIQFNLEFCTENRLIYNDFHNVPAGEINLVEGI